MILVSKASSPTSEITYPQDHGATFPSGRFFHNLDTAGEPFVVIVRAWEEWM
jgi:hypothetical protein